MPGFLAAPADIDGGRVRLRGDEVHHLSRVRRYGVGDEIDVADGAGMGYRVRLTQLKAGEAQGEVVETRPEYRESPIALSLAPALIKGPRFDMLIEKATEIGVMALRPLITQRGVVRAGSSHKPQRWQRLARAATKQCGRARIPALAAPADVAATVAALRRDHGLILLADPQAPKQSLATAIAARDKTQIGLLIGPEGGFTTAEQQAALTAGAVAFGWGERVLRADTAGILLTGLVLYEADRQWL